MNHTLLPLAEFIERRERFLQQMQSNSVAVIFAGQEVTRSNDTEYHFCQDKHFYYLTGFNEPEAVLVLINDESPKALLFCLAKNPDIEVWHGKRVGAEKAKDDYGFDDSFNLEQLDELIPDYLANSEHLYFLQGKKESLDKQLFTWLETVKGKSRQGISAPANLINCCAIIDEMDGF